MQNYYEVITEIPFKDLSLYLQHALEEYKRTGSVSTFYYKLVA